MNYDWEKFYSKIVKIFLNVTQNILPEHSFPLLIKEMYEINDHDHVNSKSHFSNFI